MQTHFFWFYFLLQHPLSIFFSLQAFLCLHRTHLCVLLAASLLTKQVYVWEFVGKPTKNLHHMLAGFIFNMICQKQGFTSWNPWTMFTQLPAKRKKKNTLQSFVPAMNYIPRWAFCSFIHWILLQLTGDMAEWEWRSVSNELWKLAPSVSHTT